MNLEMDNLSLAELKNVLRSKGDKPKVLLFDPRDVSIDQTFIDILSELTPKPIMIDFQQYDMNRRESLYYVYIDLNYFASEVAKKIGNDKLKRFIDRQFKQGLEWAKAGSQVPISNFLRGFMEEFHRVLDKYPWIILTNIDVETEINHATIGSIVFDVISSPFSGNAILSCTQESWANFEKGRDIFARIASRLRSRVRRLCREEIS